MNALLDWLEKYENIGSAVIIVENDFEEEEYTDNK